MVVRAFRWARISINLAPAGVVCSDPADFAVHQIRSNGDSAMKQPNLRAFIISGLAAAAMAATLPNSASARFYDPSLPSVAPLAEQVACRTVRTRTTYRGRTVYKSVRRCTPAVRTAQRCVSERIRVRTPAGAFTYKTVTRCR
jgi:hypothetical protein